MTIITSPSGVVYDTVSTSLKKIISDSPCLASKTAAIHTLGACTFYCDAADDEILENMSYFLDIISSDGEQISAHDAPLPVTAAIEEYGFLATLIDDLSLESEDAIDAFNEQLSSSSPGVQMAAGETIALLYEKSYRALSSDDNDHNPVSDYSPSDIVSDPDACPGVPKLLQVYTPYRRTDKLIHTLSDLASLNTHRLTKKDQKAIRTTFADVLNSIEYPTRGPRYQNAVSHETGKRYGSRMVVRIHREGVMRIDKWWKLHRLQGLRRVLQGGFVTHYERNGVVFESLP